MVKDFNKKPAFDDHMKKYDRGLPDKEKRDLLNKGVILHKAKKISPRDKIVAPA